MILGESQQQFASPEEALAHFGVKGMRWGIRKDRDPAFEGFGKPYVAGDALDHGGIKDLELRKTKNLRVDHSDGFVNIRSSNGFPSEHAQKNYESVVNELKTLRGEYPSVAAMKIEVVPLSHTPDARYTSKSTQAAVAHVAPGVIRVMYNDKVKDLSPRQQKSWSKWVPGMAYPGYAGRHEMGHVLAAAKSMVPPSVDVYKTKGMKRFDALDVYEKQNDDRHKAMFTKHGLSFPELSKLGPYASTSPAEAYAEAYGQYRTPELRATMSAETQRKVKAMLDDTGGKK